MKPKLIIFCATIICLMLLPSCTKTDHIPQFKCYNMKEELPIMEYGKNGPIFYRRVDAEWHWDKPNALALDKNGLPITLKPSDSDFFDQVATIFNESIISKVEGKGLANKFVLSFVFHDIKKTSSCSQSLSQDYWIALQRTIIGNKQNSYPIGASDCEGMPSVIKIEGITNFDEGLIVYIDENLSYQVWRIENSVFKLMLNEKVTLDHSLDWLPGIQDVSDIHNYEPMQSIDN